MSYLHLYAVRRGSGAYLSQPTLTGRFLISSHCQPEHLRRLLPWWPEMCGRLRWKDVEWGRERNGDEGQWWGRGREIQDVSAWCWYRHSGVVLFSSVFYPVFHVFNNGHFQKGLGVDRVLKICTQWKHNLSHKNHLSQVKIWETYSNIC